MSFSGTAFSGTAIEQRGKEERALKAFLAFSVIASLGIHASVLASGIVNNILNLGQEIDKEPIEVAIIETPAPKPIEKPIEPVKPVQQAPKPKIVEPIKPLVQQPPPVLPKPPVLPPVVPKPIVPPKQTVVVPKPPVQPKRTVVVTKPVVPPPKIVTPPVEKPELKPLPKIPDPAPPQPEQNLTQTLPPLRTPREIPPLRTPREIPPAGGGGGGGGGNSPRIATGSGEGTVRSGTGTGTGIGTGSGSGIGSGTGSGIGSGSGSGIGSGTGSGIGSGTGSGIGSGTGSGRSPKTEVAARPKPKIPAPTQLDFAECIKCDIKYPEKSKQRGVEGRPGVAFDIDKNGNVKNVRLISPSGHKELDNALVDSAKDFKLNSGAAGRQNVQLFANFAIQGSRTNQEAQQRQRERQERLEAQRKRQQESEQRSREAVNEQENSGRKRRALSTPPETAPLTTPDTGITGGQDTPRTPILPSSGQVTPQPPTLNPPLEQNSSSEQNGEQPSGQRKRRSLGTSDNLNNSGDQLRLPQNPSLPSEQVPSDSSGNNQ
ncbi:energy transducer TonB [Brasilonema octagenarum]|uniref:TonB C-terminal domain-containing protein n=1 Tax=Brasilonema octagenarum UFV-OR1 TaxID=417115 RepID=A0ABX1MBH2_9CYAN|nr:energy transducer TonB [Brasilonema octagenarum]NMF65963.1 hypothetical protein [Brasilonema octagenarum UFV-OR1]